MKLTKSLLKEMVIRQLDEGRKKSAIANKYATLIINSILNKKDKFVIKLDEEDKKYVAFDDISIEKSMNKPRLGQALSAKAELQPHGDGWRLNVEVAYLDTFSRKDFQFAHLILAELLTHEYTHGGSIASSAKDIKSVEDYYRDVKTIYGKAYPEISKEIESLANELPSYRDREAVRGYAKSGEIEAFIQGWMKTFKTKKQSSRYDNEFSNMIFFKLGQLKDKLLDPEHPNIQKIMDLLFKEYESYYKSRYLK
jgi:hypothetical protein